MKELLPSLIASLNAISSCNCSNSYSELNSILSKYIAALNYANNYNADYKRSTNIYFSDISNIRENIQLSLYANNATEQRVAFESAKNELRSGIEALTALFKVETEQMHDELV